MIIWLASYPKSGNTWVRIFLSHMLSNEKDININNTKIFQFPKRKDFNGLSNNIDNLNEFVKNCIHAQSRINLDNKIKIFKTHNAFWKTGNYAFTNLENTVGCIYIVRDPRNIVTSIKNHYNLENYDKSSEFIFDEKKVLGIHDRAGQENDIPTVISSWQNHYNSWKKLGTNYLLIKYEELLINPINEFSKILNFIEKFSDINFDKTALDNAIKACSFEKLKEQEELNGFVEAPKNINGQKIKFFNLGKNNKWEILLDKNTIKNIEKKFKIEMEELDYL